MNYCLDARTATDHFPGIGRYVSNLAQAMVPLLEPEERLMLFYDPSQRSGWKLPEPISRKVVLKATRFSPFGFKQQWGIPKLLKRFSVNLYHSPYYLMPYWSGVPTLLTLYDVIPQRYPEYVSFRARMLYQFAHRLALRATTRCTAISEATKKDFIDFYGVKPERIISIPLAAAPHFRPLSNKEKLKVKTTLQLPDQFVLYLGINKPHKNLLGLLTAWRLIMSNSPESDVKLVIAGAWDSRYPEVRQRTVDWGLEGSVTFLGPVQNEDMPGLYGNASVFVFPSLFEGFGLPVVEAMACGTPVACANTSSLPEVAGSAAILFDPTRPEAIAEAIQNLVKNQSLREMMRIHGLEQARMFTWSRTASETLNLYRELLR